MDTLKSQEDQFSWLDNSFTSTPLKVHAGKRNHCSLPSSGKKNMAKLHCITRKEIMNGISADPFYQDCYVKCQKNIQMKENVCSSDTESRKNRKTKTVETQCIVDDSPISPAVDENYPLSEQDWKVFLRFFFVFVHLFLWTMSVVFTWFFISFY